MVEHRNLANLLNYLSQTIKAEDIVMSYINYSFDAINVEVYPTLLNGNSLYILGDNLKVNLDDLYNYILKYNITFVVLPSIIATIFSLNYQLEATKIRVIVVGGDVFQGALKQNIEIINQYGPTETTVCATLHRYDKNDIYQNIGKPISNVKCYVLDEDLNLLPIGAVGELYIGGVGVARGYLNQPELTAERFVSNPFALDSRLRGNDGEGRGNDEDGDENGGRERLYKTGDLVRWLPDGNLEYIGRSDFQVKIRGFRIELGEIENQLLKYPGIKQAVVLVQENDGHKILVAYYVAAAELDHNQLSNYLRSLLPEYMIPSIFIYLHSLPLTSNGKLDRASLPESGFEIDKKYVAARSESEQLICDAFAKILGVKKVGVNDDFFQLGGNSLKVIALLPILQTNFDIKVIDVFNWHTPSKLAENLPVSKDAIKKNLQQIKLAYAGKLHKKPSIDNRLQEKISNYLHNIDNLQLDSSLLKPITNVLLTGATGFLGCNLLNQLLKLTNYVIYMPVRASSHAEAVDRINKKFKFYFDEELGLDSRRPRIWSGAREGGDENDNRRGAPVCAPINDIFGETHGSAPTAEKHFLDIVDDNNEDTARIIVFVADLEKPNLGLPIQEYQELTDKIDSVIHAAALVKHYGEYDKFYAANVQATVNMLEFSKRTKWKDFHYISTYSVLNHGFIPDCDTYIYTEDDLPIDTQQHINIYAQTKFQGEQQVIKYRNQGINTNIYRVGNLAFIAENCRVQENIEDNAFFNWLKFLFKLKCLPVELRNVEISPVDLTAQAIVEIFNKSQLNNQIYHLSNPYFLDLSTISLDEGRMKFKVLSIHNFIDRIVKQLNSPYNELVLKFLLHQGWLDRQNLENSTYFKVLQDRTMHVLKQLEFVWIPITKNMFNKLNLLI